MIFTEGKPNPHYDDYLYFNRIESENNKWGIAVTPTIHAALRVVVFPVNSDSITLNICTGHDPGYQILIYNLIRQWLETFDESTTEREIQAQFPYFEIKPIYNDPNWQDNLDLIVKRIANSKKY